MSFRIRVLVAFLKYRYLLHLFCGFFLGYIYSYSDILYNVKLYAKVLFCSFLNSCVIRKHRVRSGNIIYDPFGAKQEDDEDDEMIEIGKVGI